MNREKTIKVVYMITSLIMGGAQKGMVRILKRINKKKYNITVITLKNESEIILNELNAIKGIKVYNMGIKRKREIYKVMRVYKLLKEIKPHILITSLYHATIIGRILGGISGVNNIVDWEHNEDFGNIFRRYINKITSKLSVKIIADSSDVKEAVINTLKINKNKVTSVFIGGVNTNEYFIKGFNVSNSDKILVGSVGSLEYRKGYLPILSVIKDLIVEKSINLRFEIAGEGIMRNKLEDYIASNYLEDSIKLLGIVEEIPKFLNKMDIYIQPSRFEGLCITVIEAMAAGLPVVAYNVGGIKNSIDDGVTGFLVEKGDTNDFKEKVLVLAKDKQLRNDMGRKAREKVKDRYSIEKTVMQFENVLDEISQRL
jgi:glycosyltransferase involved in cell wall biosynthesis